MDENGNPVLDENGEAVTFKRKISKRKDPEAAVSYYHQAGIPKESVKEYLMTIANSDFEMWRKNNENADLYEFPFALKKMSTTEGALFDMDKLIDVSKNVIAGFSAEKVYEDVSEWAKRYDRCWPPCWRTGNIPCRCLALSAARKLRKNGKISASGQMCGNIFLICTTASLT